MHGQQYIKIYTRVITSFFPVSVTNRYSSSTSCTPLTSTRRSSIIAVITKVEGAKERNSDSHSAKKASHLNCCHYTVSRLKIRPQQMLLLVLGTGISLLSWILSACEHLPNSLPDKKKEKHRVAGVLGLQQANCKLTYSLTYLLSYLLTYLLSYLLSYLLTYLLSYLLTYLVTYLVT